MWVEPAGVGESGEAFDPRVRKALASLSPPLREAFLLKHVEELRYEEIAAITGCRVSALKMRVKRATDQLRSILEEKYG